MAFGQSEDANVALVNELSRRLNDNTRRIRILEEKLRSIDSHVNDHDQRIIDATKQFNENAVSQASEITEIKDRLANIAIDIQNIKADIRKSASITDLKEVQEYLELINPITSKFITKGEVVQMIREELKKSRG